MNANAPAQKNRKAALQEWSVRMADSLMKRHPLLAGRWHYEPGVALLAIRQVWLETGGQRYHDYIKRNIDEFVGPDGAIRTYRLEEYNLDQINEGKLLFLLYETTGDERYKKAAHSLREQLRTHPRTSRGGFWHKQIYPHQMWLDGIYMAAPFYAEFAKQFDEPQGFDDVAHQIILIERHTRDDLHQVTDHIMRCAVVPVGAGLTHQRKPGELLDHLLERPLEDKDPMQRYSRPLSFLPTYVWVGPCQRHYIMDWILDTCSAVMRS